VLQARPRVRGERHAAGLQHTARNLFGALPQVDVTRVRFTPRVDDRDDGLAGVVLRREPHLLGSRAMAEGSQVADAEPAMAAELLGRAPALAHARTPRWRSDSASASAR